MVAAAGPTLSLLVPRVGDPAPRWPQVARDGRIVWPQGSHGVALRSYTARRQDPAAGELDIDFVLHGDGPAADVGRGRGTGRRPGRRQRRAVGDAAAGWLLLAGDETALPAISRILAAADPADPGRRPARGGRPGGGAGPGRAGRGGAALAAPARRPTPEAGPLPAAVAALPRPDGEDLFAWVAAESATVRAVRADLRGRWGLRRSQHHAIGYWRRGRAMAPAG